jgi:hypothetical protein
MVILKREKLKNPQLFDERKAFINQKISKNYEMLHFNF